MKSRITNKFILELGKIKSAELFCGVARILKVDLVDENKEVRKFEDVFTDVVTKYDKESKMRKKELLEILKQANACKEDVLDGNSAEDSAKAISDKEM